MKLAPPWLVSLVVHLVLLLVLGLIVTNSGPGPFNLLLAVGGGGDSDVFEVAQFSVEGPGIEADEPSMEAVEVSTPTDAVPLLETHLQKLTQISDTGPQASDKGSDNGGPSAAIPMPAPVGGMMAGRTGPAKQGLLGALGGTQETQNAVTLGLKWLARQQRADGSWSLRGPYSDGTLLGENATAATSMAMLAFLGDGHTHQSGDYIQQMEKATRWLLKQQDREGNLVRVAPSDQYLYSHAQGTIVLCELYGMTGDSLLKGPAQKAVDYAIACQSSEGGWRYNPRIDADTSVTGWFVMALVSARSAGLTVPGSVLDHVGRFLDTVQNDEGATYAYQPAGPSTPAMTAEGLLSRMYLGWPHDQPQLQLGVSVLLDQAPFKIDDPNAYYWYYATQVMHHYGGSPWDMWNNKMRVELPAAQRRNGPEAGSWAPQSTAGAAKSVGCIQPAYRSTA